MRASLQGGVIKSSLGPNSRNSGIDLAPLKLDRGVVSAKFSRAFMPFTPRCEPGDSWSELRNHGRPKRDRRFNGGLQAVLEWWCGKAFHKSVSRACVRGLEDLHLKETATSRSVLDHRRTSRP